MFRRHRLQEGAGELDKQVQDLSKETGHSPDLGSVLIALDCLSGISVSVLERGAHLHKVELRITFIHREDLESHFLKLLQLLLDSVRGGVRDYLRHIEFQPELHQCLENFKPESFGSELSQLDERPGLRRLHKLV